MPIVPTFFSTCDNVTRSIEPSQPMNDCQPVRLPIYILTQLDPLGSSNSPIIIAALPLPAAFQYLISQLATSIKIAVRPASAWIYCPLYYIVSGAIRGTTNAQAQAAQYPEDPGSRIPGPGREAM